MESFLRMGRRVFSPPMVLERVEFTYGTEDRRVFRCTLRYSVDWTISISRQLVPAIILSVKAALPRKTMGRIEFHFNFEDEAFVPASKAF